MFHFYITASKMTAILLLLFISSCTIYKSPERKQFESEYPQFSIHSLSKTYCSGTSVIPEASASKLVYISNEEPQVSLWEHIVDEKSVFESNNFQGEYCIYEHSAPKN